MIPWLVIMPMLSPIFLVMMMPKSFLMVPKLERLPFSMVMVLMLVKVPALSMVLSNQFLMVPPPEILILSVLVMVPKFWMKPPEWSMVPELESIPVLLLVIFAELLMVKVFVLEDTGVGDIAFRVIVDVGSVVDGAVGVVGDGTSVEERAVCTTNDFP